MRAIITSIALVVLLAGCTAPAGPLAPSGPASDGEPRAASAPKRITMAILVDPTTVRDNRSRPFPALLAAGLTLDDEAGDRRAVLAEAVPSTQNGTWKVFPDGRMETTWRLREGTRWHDGQPLTSEDLLFTATLGRDRELPELYDPAFDLVERVEALDRRTVVVTWKQPFIEADTLFSFARMRVTVPFPRHLLERPYLESKATLEALPYWTTELISSGPFRLREWVVSNYARLEAFPDYAPGRPKVDLLEVKFITDPNTLIANVLAGSADLTAPRALSIEQAVAARELWRDGKVVASVEGWTMMYPQHHHPSPAVLGEAQFRRALVHAIDRQQLADTLGAGHSTVAHSIVAPDQAQYRFVESSIARYDHDPRRAVQTLEGMGLARRPDGAFVDSNGERISLKIQTTINDTSQKTAFATADFWQRIGIMGDVTVLSPAAGGRPDRWAYTGFDLVNQSHGVDGITNVLHSSAAPLPERNYMAPAAARNRGSYVNPEYDAVMDRYLTTIPMGERMQALAQLVRWQTDLQLVIGFFYSVNGILLSDRLVNVHPGTGWNAHEWAVTG